jgi:hypothetical protein
MILPSSLDACKLLVVQVVVIRTDGDPADNFPRGSNVVAVAVVFFFPIFSPSPPLYTQRQKRHDQEIRSVAHSLHHHLNII